MSPPRPPPAPLPEEMDEAKAETKGQLGSSSGSDQDQDQDQESEEDSQDSDYDGNDGDCSDYSEVSEAEATTTDDDDDSETDDTPDLYLTNMLRNLHRLKGEEAEWVAEYIKAQRDWKAKYGTSIDDVHPDWSQDLQEAPNGSKTPSIFAQDSRHHLLSRRPSGSFVFVEENYWNKRVVPRLPVFLRSQNQEQVISLLGVSVVVLMALSFQFYVAFLKT